MSGATSSKPLVASSSPKTASPTVSNVTSKAPVVQPTSFSAEPKPTPPEPVAAAAPAAESEPAAVAVPEVPLPQIPVGATVTLNGKDLSDQPGQVMLQIGDIAVPATIKEWKNDAVVCTLPVLGLTKASRATLHVLKADGKTASTMSLELVTTLPTLAGGKAGSGDSVKFDE